MFRTPLSLRVVLVAAACLGMTLMGSARTGSARAASAPPSALMAFGGPDGGGYYFLDSNESGGPAYSTEWEDLSSSGTSVTWSTYSSWGADDEGEAELNLGFTFSFYGNSYTTCWMNTNAFVKFGSQTTATNNGAAAYSATTLPNSQQPNIVAVDWRDWNPSAAGLYQTFGSSPNRRFVAQWGTTHQVKLFESGEIMIVHSNYTPSGCVGIQNVDGTIGLLYSFQGSPVTLGANRVIQFIPGPTPTVNLGDPTLSQFQSDGTTSISTGGTTYNSTIIGSASLSNSGGASRRIQLEARLATAGFTGAPTHTGNASTSDTLTARAGNLAPGLYHWRARAWEPTTGYISNWVAFGGNDSSSDATDANGATDFEAIRAIGGPDTYGYTFIDNRAPNGPTASTEYQNISSSGTTLTLSATTANAWASLSVPIMIRFYGQNWGTAPSGSSQSIVNQNIVVTSNLFLRLLGASQSNGNVGTPAANPVLPSLNATLTPAGIIAVLWDGLGARGSNDAVQWEVVGTAPDRRLIIQWTDWSFAAAGEDMTVQVQITESTGEKESELYFIYQNINAANESGSSATIGIQSPTPSGGSASFLQYSLNTTGAVSPDSSGNARIIKFTPPPGPPPPDPTNLGQFLSDGTTAISIGGTTTEAIPTMSVTTDNPDGWNRRLQVEVRPTTEAFTGTPTHSGANDTGSSLSVSVFYLAPGNYHWRARVFQPAIGQASGWVAFGGNDNATDATDPNGATDLEVLVVAPPDPTDLGQFLANGTTAVGVGDSTLDSTFVFSGTTDNPIGFNRRLQVEVRPTGQPFTGNSTHEGTDSNTGVSTVTVTNLSPALYHWRARVVEPDTGLASAWVPFGGNDNVSDATDANGATDFAVLTPLPPDPTNLAQFMADGTTAINTGGVTIENSVVLVGGAANPIGVNRRLQVEVRLTSQGFTGTVTHESMDTTIDLQTITISGLTQGAYHWQGRLFELATGQVSAWVPFGGNDSSTDPTDLNGAADFEKSVPLAALTALSQFPVATGASMTQTSIILRGLTDNPDGENRRIQVEVRPTSQPFTGTFTHEGSNSAEGLLAVNVAGLAVGGYHWRARVIEPGSGLFSPWAAYGFNDNQQDPSDANGNPDFTVQISTVPALSDPTALAQFPMPAGGSTTDTAVILRGSVSNPLATDRRLQVEVRLTSQPFVGVFTHEGVNSASGQLTVSVLNLALGSYHWRARVIEASTGNVSNWVAFGGNDRPNDATDVNGATDFAVQSTSQAGESRDLESAGSPRCGQGVSSGGPAAGGLWFGFAVLVAWAAAVRMFRK